MQAIKHINHIETRETLRIPESYRPHVQTHRTFGPEQNNAFHGKTAHQSL